MRPGLYFVLCDTHSNLSFRLGENPFTMSALQSFLVDRINALDMDGSLVKSILKVCHSLYSSSSSG